MLLQFIKNIFGTQNERKLKQMGKIVDAINTWEPTMEALSDQQIKKLTGQYKQRIKDGETLEDLLPEAFATVREVSKRVLSMRHFDVQLLGGIVLHRGQIAEMRTGEGKTLVATLAAYLNALTEKGVHIVTVNDYLAKRDAHWMGPIYHALDISVSIIQSSGPRIHTSFIYQPEEVTDDVDKFEHLQFCSRSEAYATDITYGTNNEFGFDYLRTNMVRHKDDRLQKELNFAIIDEVDSILIDEARTPLIISGSVDNRSNLYNKIDNLIAPLILQPLGHTTLLTALAKGEISSFADKDYFTHLGLDSKSLEIIDNLRLLEKDNLLKRAEKKIKFHQLIDELKQTLNGDFCIDEKLRNVELTESGFEKMEDSLIDNQLLELGDSLYQTHNLNLLQHINNALRAHYLFSHNKEYIIQGDNIMLVDEHTGRTMPGRRLSEGLHQAIEAKENVTIQSESQTLASTTFQNYFRQYEKLAGMTGTADTEASEFKQIYGLSVLVIPTNQPINRTDHNDLIFLRKQDKYNALIESVKQYQANAAPVLIGTASIEVSETMSQLLTKQGIKHKVLNAKFHQQEAEIIATAGEPGRVTIATNMAGRGTDIVLGGNLENSLAQATKATGELSKEQKDEIVAQWRLRNTQVIEAGGLHIIGTERHESRRIDNQLRGRAGRQGDPGMSCFYLSMEDDLMRLFASERVFNMMRSMGMDNEAIEHKLVNNSVARAQHKVEQRNFDIRKTLLEYDDVASDQRQVIYQWRNRILDNEDSSAFITSMRQEVINSLVDEYLPPQTMEEQWDVEELDKLLTEKYQLLLNISTWLTENNTGDQQDLKKHINLQWQASYQTRVIATLDQTSIQQLEKDVMLHTLDQHWREHLATMDHLRSSIGLRSYAQKNPKQEYKRESFQLFQRLLKDFKHEVIIFLSTIQLLSREEADKLHRQQEQQEEQINRSIQMRHADSRLVASKENQHLMTTPTPTKPSIRQTVKIKRNQPCPCGSNKKYKQCCGKS